jgi:hypothetical protein
MFFIRMLRTYVNWMMAVTAAEKRRHSASSRSICFRPAGDSE